MRNLLLVIHTGGKIPDQLQLPADHLTINRQGRGHAVVARLGRATTAQRRKALNQGIVVVLPQVVERNRRIGTVIQWGVSKKAQNAIAHAAIRFGLL